MGTIVIARGGPFVGPRAIAAGALVEVFEEHHFLLTIGVGTSGVEL